VHGCEHVAGDRVLVKLNETATEAAFALADLGHVVVFCHCDLRALDTPKLLKGVLEHVVGDLGVQVGDKERAILNQMPDHAIFHLELLLLREAPERLVRAHVLFEAYSGASIVPTNRHGTALDLALAVALKDSLDPFFRRILVQPEHEEGALQTRGCVAVVAPAYLPPLLFVVGPHVAHGRVSLLPLLLSEGVSLCAVKDVEMGPSHA
jgi:hypothetical protein